jgi:uncharacterized membrane protein
MADMATVTKGAKKAVGKAAKAGDGPLGKPGRLAAAGVALAAIPVAIEKIAKIGGPKVADSVSGLGEKAKDKAKGELKDVVDDVKPKGPGALIGGLFGGGDSDDEGGENGNAAPGHGSGRRMPVQQAIDVSVPLKVAYNHWTRFEDWPEFMHRIDSAEQVDDATVSFKAKIWGINKRFEADILDQVPDERIAWNVSQGYAHTGVVTFHELSPRLTRIEITLDVEPSNIIDKASRGMRFVKRAVRGDLHRFKAHVELADEEESGWRGRIEDGSVKKQRARSNGSSSNGKRKSSSSSRSNGRAGSSAKGSSAKRSTAKSSNAKSSNGKSSSPRSSSAKSSSGKSSSAKSSNGKSSSAKSSSAKSSSAKGSSRKKATAKA